MFFVLEIMKGAVVQAVVDRVEDGDKEKKKKQRRRRSKQNSSASGTLINFPFFFFFSYFIGFRIYNKHTEQVSFLNYWFCVPEF